MASDARKRMQVAILKSKSLHLEADLALQNPGPRSYEYYQSLLRQIVFTQKIIDTYYQIWQVEKDGK